MEKEKQKISKNDPSVIFGWSMFDWANSAFALVITTAVFPLYFNGVVDDEFLFLGMSVKDTSIFSFSITVAYIIISLALPMLTGIADYGGRKLAFMKAFTVLGSLACISLVFFTGMSTLWVGLLGFVLAMIGFAGGQVFYNSFLPDIVTDDKFDSVSAKGYSYGYLGSVILLIVNLVMIQKPELFGLSGPGIASRVSFVMVGLWWIGFAQISFNRLPKDHPVKNLNGVIAKGYAEIKSVWNNLKTLTNTRRFLISFFFYSAGVQTAIFLASTFATDVLNFESSELIFVVILLQLVGILGAVLFSKMSSKIGNKTTLMIILVIWIIVCVAGYFVQGKTMFYFIAAGVGLVMGGVQSMSRSTYSKLLPTDIKETASYFSFYDVLEKTAIVLGTLTFGMVDQFLGMRNSLLALTVFFLIGLILLSRLEMKKADYA